MTLDRTPADPQGVGDLGLGEVEVVAQREHLALALRQRTHRFQYGGPPGEALGRLGRLRARGVRTSFDVPVDHHPVPQRRPGLVDHGLAQVGERLVVVAQRSQRRCIGDERVLDDLFGGALVAHEQHGQTDQPRQWAAYSCSSAASAVQEPSAISRSGAVA